MPYMGNDVTTVRGMTEVMDDLTGNTLPGFTSIAQQISTTQLNNANGQLNLQAIADIQDEFAKANQQLQQQREKYGNLPTPKIKIVASAYQQGRDKLDDLAQTVDGMNSAMQMVPELLGQNGARTYLLAIQTPSEQRSGGGLVGSLGTFHADQGTVTVGELHPDGTLLNGNNGNAEEKAVFNGPLAFSFDLRDTFAVPDIARNAEMLNATWQRSPYACNIDGLLAVDPVFIQEMVGISGDVRLENGTVLNGSNTAQYLLNTIYKSVPAEQQDAYFNYVAQTVLNNAFNSMSVEKLLNMGQIIGSMAQERHLYAYTFHEDEADHFQGAGTAKSAPGSADEPQVGIYLNEQNSSKLGWYIDRKAMVTADRTNQGRRPHLSCALHADQYADRSGTGNLQLVYSRRSAKRSRRTNRGRLRHFRAAYAFLCSGGRNNRRHNFDRRCEGSAHNHDGRTERHHQRRVSGTREKCDVRIRRDHFHEGEDRSDHRPVPIRKNDERCGLSLLNHRYRPSLLRYRRA